MKDALKIAIIGGGSSYTPEIVEGFILRYAELFMQSKHMNASPLKQLLQAVEISFYKNNTRKGSSLRREFFCCKNDYC